VAVGFVLLMLLGWISFIGALIAGFVAGLIAGGVRRGAEVGFIAGIIGGIIAVALLSLVGTALAGLFGAGLLSALIGVGIGAIIFFLAVINTILAAIGGLVGGAIRS
jgi:hypothetical protein